jgi:hypothetical protein
VPILDAVHDFAHPVEGDAAWSESYYFNGYDPDADCGLFTRIGVRPNEGTLDAGLSVWLPGTDIATVHGVRPQAEMTDSALEAAGVRYERLVPMRTWRLSCDAEATLRDLDRRRATRKTRLRMDVRFEALTPAVGVDGSPRPGAGASTAAGQSTGKGHLEQAGRLAGWVEADGRRHEITGARGNRDKSWGPRRWGGPAFWRWFSINLGDDMHFGGILIGTAAGELHRGWVWRDGAFASIREWDVESELAEDGLTHRATRVRARDAKGRVHALRGDVLRVAPVVHEAAGRRTVINEGLARWTCEGRQGYGIAEYLHQLDGEGRPVVPVR